jgi:hypothetical protein
MNISHPMEKASNCLPADPPLEHPAAAAKLKCREISHLWDDAIPEAHARRPEIRELPFLSQAIGPFSLTAVMVRRLTL